jgi:MSHA biogenesis protein MshM
MQRVERSAVDPPAPTTVRAPCPYLSHFGLREVPFRATADPRRLWLGRVRRSTFDSLSAALRDGEGVVLLTGKVGTGKTSLAHGLAERLRDAGLGVGVISPSGAEPVELLQAVTAVFRETGALDGGDGPVTSCGALLDRAGSIDRKLVLIIDEAQEMGAELLRETAELTRLASQHRCRLAVLLVGQNDKLNALLSDHRLELLNKQITLHCTLEVLSPAEVGDYIRHYLATAGAHYEIFSVDAIHEIARLSGGIPASINVLGELALLTGRQRGVRTITQEIVVDSGWTPPPGEATVPSVVRPASISQPSRRIRASVVRRATTISVGVVAAAVLVVGGYSLYARSSTGLRREPSRPVLQAPLALEPSEKSRPADTPAPTPPPALLQPPAVEKPPAIAPTTVGAAGPSTERAAPAAESTPSVSPPPPPAPAKSVRPKETPPRERGVAADTGAARSPEAVRRRESAIDSKRGPTPVVVEQRNPRSDATVSSGLPPKTSDQDRDTPDPAAIVDWFLKEYSPSSR